ncbi:MAG: hypothetical protein MI864_14975 [Pseudomonadales bacterium]|nr:hypothetical protein [Pseudomonadales bacterium]
MTDSMLLFDTPLVLPSNGNPIPQKVNSLSVDEESMAGLPQMEIQAFQQLLKSAADNYYETGTYQYPAQPGDNVWKQLSPTQMYMISQIPREIILALPTDELIELMLSNPFSGNVLAFDTVAVGFNKVIGKSNLFKALVNRPDGISKLMRTYASANYTGIKETNNRLLRSKDSFKTILLQQSLVHESVLEEVRNNPTFVQLVSHRLRDSVNHTNKYSRLNVESEDLMIQKILKGNGYFGTEMRDSALKNVADKYLKGRGNVASDGTISLTHAEYRGWMLDLISHNADKLTGDKK